MTRGGRSAALAALTRIDPVAYGRTRNHLDGAVTRLSPYLRHGVLTLAEVRGAALAMAGPSGAYTLVNELSWQVAEPALRRHRRDAARVRPPGPGASA